MDDAAINDLLVRGTELQGHGKFAESERLYRQVLGEHPDHPHALHLLGLLAQRVGKHDEAVRLISRAILANPQVGEFHHNLGNSLLQLRRFPEAAGAYEKAAALDPSLMESHVNRGAALMLDGRSNEAVQAYEAAAKAIPQSPEVHNNLGLALKDQGRVSEAIAQFRRAIELRPDYQHAHGNLLYALHFDPSLSAEAIFQEHRGWARQFADPLAANATAVERDRTFDRRLRIGYVSPNLGEHPVGRSMLPILEHHDRERFEAICYADHVVTPGDPVTARLRAAADQWHIVAGVSDERLAMVIREHQIDILVDLTLHMNRNRLLVFARRPAPVQATFLGYPATTGLSQIDYRITDTFLDPLGETQDVNSEQLVHLSHSFWCYPDDPAAPPVGELPTPRNGFVTFGSLNNPCKINDAVIDLWSRILHAVPRSRLMLYVVEKREVGSRFRALFWERGIGADRLHFVSREPRERYLARYNEIDIGLDPFPYNGHMTSCDALFMGVPVVSLTGATSVARGGESLLSNMELLELLADSPEQYVRIATDLAGDLQRVAGLRRRLRDRMRSSPLMDASGFVRDLESLYRSMWRRWCTK